MIRGTSNTLAQQVPALALHDLAARGVGPLSFTLPAHAYGCLMGPSGAGKTALLRAIAGLDAHTGGLRITGEPTGAASRRHTIAMLGQGADPPLDLPAASALRAALARAGVARHQRDAKTGTLLEEFALDGAAKPRALHPEARLLVRLAIALAGSPRVLLLDDPLAGVGDWRPVAELIRDAASRRKLAVLHATARREEALALADTLVLLDSGQLLQAGTVAELYERPASLHIASRLGPVNVLPGTLRGIDNDVAEVQLDCGPLIEADPPADPDAPPGARCSVVLRPERIAVTSIAAAQLGGTAIAALLREVRHRGDTLLLRLAIGTDGDITVSRPAALGASGLVAGRTVSVAWQSQHALTFLAKA